MNSTLKAQNHRYSVESSVQSASFDSSALIIEVMAVPIVSTDEGMSERCFLLEYLDHSHFSRNQAITQYKCLDAVGL